jgi:hypothetical protein
MAEIVFPPSVVAAYLNSAEHRARVAALGAAMRERSPLLRALAGDATPLDTEPSSSPGMNQTDTALKEGE